MKIRLLQMGTVLTMFLLALASCSKEQAVLTPESGEVTDGSDARTYSFVIRTGAESYAQLMTPAEEREKKIQSLHAYLFSPQGKFVEKVTPQQEGTTEGHYTIKTTKAGSYQMVLVANLGTDITLDADAELSTLNSKLVTSTAGHATCDHFVMRNMGESISIVTYDEGGSDYRDTPILLERLAARFDVNNLSTSYTITKIEMKNSATESMLFNNNGEGKNLLATREFTENTGLDPALRGGSAKAIYAYENSPATAEASKCTSFTISGNINNVNLKDLIITFATVKRNHLYRVQITDKGTDIFKPEPPKEGEDPLKRQLTLNIEVLDWNTGEVLKKTKVDLDKIAKGTKVGMNILIAEQEVEEETLEFS